MHSAQFAAHHDEAALIQSTQEDAAQLRELFESDGLAPEPLKAAEGKKP